MSGITKMNKREVLKKEFEEKEIKRQYGKTSNSNKTKYKRRQNVDYDRFDNKIVMYSDKERATFSISSALLEELEKEIKCPNKSALMESLLKKYIEKHHGKEIILTVAKKEDF